MGLDLKSLGHRVGWVRARRWVWTYQVLSGMFDPDRAMSLVSEGVARVPGLLGVYTRQQVYRPACRRGGGYVGEDVHFGYGTLLSKAAAEFGDRAYLGRYCTLGLVSVGRDAKLADGVQVLSGANQHGDEPRYERVVIGARAWIGAGAVVMADVGADAVVAAGAVVRTPVAAGQRVAGVPARVISRRRATSSEVFDGALIQQRREGRESSQRRAA